MRTTEDNNLELNKEKIAQKVRKKTNKNRKRKQQGKKKITQKIKLTLPVINEEKKKARVTDINEYKNPEDFQKRKEKKLQRKRNRRRILLLILIAILLVVFFLTAPFFKIKTITCEGNENLTDVEIINASNIGVGYNIYRTSFRIAEKNILKLPYVESVSFDRKFPNKVEITVTERNISASFEMGKEVVLVDKSAHVLEVGNSVPSGVTAPVITGLDISAAKPGDMIECKTNGKAEFIANVLTALDKSGLIRDVTAIDATDVENLTFMIKDSLKVTVGGNENVDYKITFLADKAYQNLGDGTTGFLDVSNGREGVYRENERNVKEIAEENIKRREEEERRQQEYLEELARQNGELTEEDEDEDKDDEEDKDDNSSSDEESEE